MRPGGGGVEGMRGYNSKKLDLGESILEMHKRQRVALYVKVVKL